MRRRLLSTILVVLAASCGKPSERSVEGNVLTSTRWPPVTIEFDKSLTYVGSQEFVLHVHAQVEQHFFVEDVGGVIKRLYWIQFEGYLDNNTYIYNYSNYPTIPIAGHNFNNNSGFAQVPEVMPEDGSDQAHATAFLYDHGYEFAREGMFQRMIWLWDESARNELMIIFVEDLAEYGYAAADFEAGGKAADHREAMTKALLDRALAGMKITDR